MSSIFFFWSSVMPTCWATLGLSHQRPGPPARKERSIGGGPELAPCQSCARAGTAGARERSEAKDNSSAGRLRLLCDIILLRFVQRGFCGDFIGVRRTQVIERIEGCERRGNGFRYRGVHLLEQRRVVDVGLDFGHRRHDRGPVMM